MDDEFESQYADELELLRELENDDPVETKSTLNQKKSNSSIKIVPKKYPTDDNSDNDGDLLPFQEIEKNTNKKKPRLDDDIELESMKEVDAMMSNATTKSHSSIEIRKLTSTLNKTNLFEHNHYLKLSKNLNITYLNGKKTTIRIWESEDPYEKTITMSKSTSLLEKPISTLKMEITTDVVERCKKSIADSNTDYGMELDKIIKDADQNLWVEKFSPKGYIDLLSDDGINRLLLTWIKSWDHVVFGRELPSNDKKQQKLDANNKLANKKRKRIFNQNEIELEEKLSELDEYKRPKIKVALLSGPPGIGKTTLAHIVAERAGYNVIELNASDDRSVDSFKQHIDSVTQIKGNVTDKNFKPNCLIIDEIDGAPQNAIQVLVNQINENSNKKTKSKDGPSLLRPIICICNDLYAPALKQLKQLSLVFQCPPLSTHRLAERLYTICEQNNLSADLDALIALSDKSSNDIRSCLNTLQFLSKTTSKVTTQIVNQLNVGQKDYEKGIFTILNEIFFLTNYKKTSNKNDVLYSMLNKFNYMVQLCNNCDMERLLLALHENFLSIRIRECNFDSINSAYEWILFTDKLNKYIKEKQEYHLYNYQKYLTVVFNLLFSTTSQQTKKLQYPHSYYECLSKFFKNENILTHFLTDMSASVRVAHNTRNDVILELFPFLHEIIQPNLRAVSTQLFSKAERERLDNLIKTMILFSINYRQERGSDGQYAYLLDPAFDEIIRFNGLKQHKQLCYMIKQQISREITIEKLKMADKYKNATSQNELIVKLTSNANPSSSQTKSSEPNNFFSSPVGLKTASIMNKFKNATTKKDTPKIQETTTNENKNEKKKEMPKESNDIFARYFKKVPKEPKPGEQETPVNKQQKTPPGSLSKSPQSLPPQFSTNLWLKYKEGFINAVRYNIKISKLL